LLIEIFPTTPKPHSNSSEIFTYDFILFYFSVKKSFNIQELLHCKSKPYETKPMHPSSSRAFQRDQEHDLKHPGSMDLMGTKQNKLPSFIDRWFIDPSCIIKVSYQNACTQPFMENGKRNLITTASSNL
jgi:hypothetical protein